MKKILLLVFVTGMLLSSCASNHAGLREDFSDISGWYEVLPEGDTVKPSVIMKNDSGVLFIHHAHRSLEHAYEWCPWIKWKRDYCTNLRKKYGVLDLDKYHYVVLDLAEKGSSSYFDINGFQTKLGYTTGTTVIDLKDYDHEGIRGIRNVDFGIEMQDNNTHLIIKELKFVSELTGEERKRLTGAGLIIRDENQKARPFHNLIEIKKRSTINLPRPEGEEMAIFRDDATGAVTTRLTCMPGDDNFGEGGIWSADGEAIKFESPRISGNVPVCYPGTGKITGGPQGSRWSIWSPVDPDILYSMTREGFKFNVAAWNKSTGKQEKVTEFTVPGIGSYVEFKNFSKDGKLIVGFRETPHLYLIDFTKKDVRYIKLPVRLKDATIDGSVLTYANCYTFELRTYDIETGEEGLAPSFSAGHASWGENGMVANFGGHMNIFVPGDIGRAWSPGDKISVWANWKNDIVTDYGNLTFDNKYVFTNGRNADVDSQHLMIPSMDPGAVMRVAKYFTKFSWTSTTYSRPSPDYTKLIYNENMMGNTELHMIYTRRPGCPENTRMEDGRIAWDVPEPNREIAGYNLYASNTSGRGFTRINNKLLTETSVEIDPSWKYFAVTSVEHSGFESNLSHEVSESGAHSFYFEAEEMNLVPPARRFFDGYCNNFQCARINAQSDEEKSGEGKIEIAPGNIPAGDYKVWGRVKGNGKWHNGAQEFEVSSASWEWISLGTFSKTGPYSNLLLYSGDDALKLDMVLVTSEDFRPSAQYPADDVAPAAVKNFSAVRSGKKVFLEWEPASDTDFHHYSIYCGETPDFTCDNSSIIRSVLKNSMTDALPEVPNRLYYKIIAFDSRLNASEPVLEEVK